MYKIEEGKIVSVDEKSQYKKNNKNYFKLVLDGNEQNLKNFKTFCKSNGVKFDMTRDIQHFTTLVFSKFSSILDFKGKVNIKDDAEIYFSFKSGLGVKNIPKIKDFINSLQIIQNEIDTYVKSGKDNNVLY